MDSAELFSFEAPSDQGCSLIFNNAPFEVDDSDIIAFFEEGVGPVYRLFFFDNPGTPSFIIFTFMRDFIMIYFGSEGMNPFFRCLGNFFVPLISLLCML